MSDTGDDLDDLLEPPEPELVEVVETVIDETGVHEIRSQEWVVPWHGPHAGRPPRKRRALRTEWAKARLEEDAAKVGERIPWEDDDTEA